MYTPNHHLLHFMFLSFCFIYVFNCFYILLAGTSGTKRNAKGDGPQEKRGNKPQVRNDKGKRKNRRRKGGRKPGRLAIYGSAINQLRRDVGFVMSRINTETKYIDTTALSTFTGAWTLVLLNGMTTGTSSVTRNGQSIKASGLEAKFFITMNSAATAIQSYRLVVFLDKQPNAAAPTATDVYPASSVSPRTVGYLDRFSVLWEKWAILDLEFPTGEIEQFSKGLSFHVEFNTGVVGDITDITKNSVYFMFYSDAGANFPSVRYYFRFTFVDN